MTSDNNVGSTEKSSSVDTCRDRLLSEEFKPGKNEVIIGRGEFLPLARFPRTSRSSTLKCNEDTVNLTLQFAVSVRQKSDRPLWKSAVSGTGS